MLFNSMLSVLCIYVLIIVFVYLFVIVIVICNLLDDLLTFEVNTIFLLIYYL